MDSKILYTRIKCESDENGYNMLCQPIIPGKFFIGDEDLYDILKAREEQAVDDTILTTEPGMLGKDPELHLREKVWYSFLNTKDTVVTCEFHSWQDYRNLGSNKYVVSVTILYTADDKLTAQAIGTSKLRRAQSKCQSL
jgi:hypothetical protein